MLFIGVIGATGLFFYPMFRETHNRPLLNYIQEVNSLPEDDSPLFLEKLSE
jgi:hypothetical protein